MSVSTSTLTSSSSSSSEGVSTTAASMSSPYGSSSSCSENLGVVRDLERYVDEGGRELRGFAPGISANPIVDARHLMNLVSGCSRAKRASLSSIVSHLSSDLSAVKQKYETM